MRSTGRDEREARGLTRARWVGEGCAAREGITPDKEGEVGPLKQMESLKKKGHPLAYVGQS